MTPDMTPGERGIAVRMWNRGKRELEIAQWLDRPVAVIKAYLATRRGWPGVITGKNPSKAAWKQRASKTAYTNGCRPGQWGGPRPGSGRKKGSPANGTQVKGALAAAVAKSRMRGVITLQRVRALDDHRWTCPVQVIDRPRPWFWERV